MQVVVQLVFGWPGIMLFLGMATVGVWQPKLKALGIALLFSLGPAFYLLGGNGWIQGVGLYIPSSLLISAILVKHKQLLIPRMLLVPLYGFYIWFGFMVAMQ